MALDGGTRNGHDNNSYYSPYDAKDRDANWNIAELEGIKKKVVDNIPEFGNIETTTPSHSGEEVYRERISRRMREDDELVHSYWSAGIYRRQDMHMLDAFHRFPRIDPYRAIPTNREYAFFVKPNLHLFNGTDSGTLNPELQEFPFFASLLARGYGPLMAQLEADVDKSHPFINILTNRKIGNIDMPTIQAEDIETGQNFYGTRLKYRRGTERSDEECDFSVEFEDTKYLEIYLLFKIFDEYEKRKWYGQITPPNDWYIENKILHDQIAVYKFVVGEDGESLIYWAKFTGVYPVVIPRDIFSDIPQDGHLKLTVQFRAMFVEDMMPNIISDFNAISAPNGLGKLIPLWDLNIQGVSGENVYIPRIGTTVKSAEGYSGFSLVWYSNP